MGSGALGGEPLGGELAVALGGLTGAADRVVFRRVVGFGGLLPPARVVGTGAGAGAVVGLAGVFPGAPAPPLAAAWSRLDTLV